MTTSDRKQRRKRHVIRRYVEEHGVPPGEVKDKRTRRTRRISEFVLASTLIYAVMRFVVGLDTIYDAMIFVGVLVFLLLGVGVPPHE